MFDRSTDRHGQPLVEMRVNFSSAGDEAWRSGTVLTVVIVVVVGVVVDVVNVTVIVDDNGSVSQRRKDEEEENDGEKEQRDAGRRVEKLAILNAEIPDAAQNHRHQRKHETRQVEFLNDHGVILRGANATTVSTAAPIDATTADDAARDETMDDSVIGDVVMAEGEMIGEHLTIENETDAIR